MLWPIPDDDPVIRTTFWLDMAPSSLTTLGLPAPNVRVERPAATDARTKKLRTGGSARTRG